MFKTLLVGAALGFFGKKLYDEGKLDPYIARAKDKVGELSGQRSTDAPPRGVGSPDQPNVAF